MSWFRRRRRRRGDRHRPLDVRAIAVAHLDAGDPTGWFEVVYAGASGDAAQVPWVASAPHPYLVDWLGAPVTPVSGRRAAVVGCGLGDDAAAVAAHGYEVTAFDVAPTAVAWAQQRFPDVDVQWLTADLLDPSEALVGAFDLVVEVATVPHLPGVVRDAAMQRIAGLAAPGGVAVTIGLLATSQEAADAWSGPPWPQVPPELAAYRAGGLTRIVLEHADADEDGLVEFRATWRR